MALTGVERYGRASDTSTSRSYKVFVHNPSFDKVVELLEKRKGACKKIKDNIVNIVFLSAYLFLKDVQLNMNVT